jgi:hypothetical protein
MVPWASPPAAKRWARNAGLTQRKEQERKQNVNEINDLRLRHIVTPHANPNNIKDLYNHFMGLTIYF